MTDEPKPPSIHDQTVTAQAAAVAYGRHLTNEVWAGRMTEAHAQSERDRMAAAIRSLEYLRVNAGAIKSAIAYVRAHPEVARLADKLGAQVLSERPLAGAESHFEQED